MTRKVYFNGNIITVDSKESIAQAMLIEDGKIKAVGNNDEILNLLDENTEKIESEEVEKEDEDFSEDEVKSLSYDDLFEEKEEK